MGAQDTEQLGAREGAGGKDQGKREGLPLSGRDLFRQFPKLIYVIDCKRVAWADLL